MTTSIVKDFRDVEIEKVEAFWDARPCNIRHSTREVGSREYFDDVERRKYFVELHIPAFAQFDCWKGKKVLEIGCGMGTMAMNWARNGARVTAVDLGQTAIEQTRKRFELFGLKGQFIPA